MCGRVRSAGDHPVCERQVHQHSAEIRDVAHDFARAILSHPLVRAQASVFGPELVAQPAALGIEHPGIGQVDTEFCATAPNDGLCTQDAQIDDAAGEQAPGGEQDAIIVALREHDVATVGGARAPAAGTRTSAG